MWLLVPALASAGLRADVDTAARAAPDMALVCTSASDAWDRFGRMVRAFAKEDEKMPADVRALFLDESGTVPALFEPGAKLSVAFWKASGAAEIVFDTTRTPEDIATRLAGMDPDGKSAAVEGPDGWIIREQDGQQSRVFVKEGRAHVLNGAPPTDATRLVPKALMDTMPETPGCVALAHVSEEGVGELDLAVHISFGDAEPATFAVAGPSVEAFRGVVFEPGDPPEVRTTETPQGVVVLGMGIDGVDFSTFLQGKELRRARRFQSWFPVTSGTTVALLRSDPQPVFGAVLPLPEKMRARRIARRAIKVAKSQDFEIQKTDRTHFLIDLVFMQLHFAAQDGRLLMANDPGVLGAMESAQGTPWVQGRAADLAARYPLVVTSSVLPGVSQGPMEEPFSFGVDLEPGLVSGEVLIPLSIEELAAVAKMLKEREEAGSTPGLAPAPMPPGAEEGPPFVPAP